MKKQHFISNVFLILCAVIALFPVVFTFSNSFMNSKEFSSRYGIQITEDNQKDYSAGGIHFVRFGLLPEKPDIEQYVNLLFENPAYLRNFWNSVFLTAAILAGQFILAPLAAFGFENMSWSKKEILFFFYVVIMLMPMQVLLVPNFLVINWLNIQGSYLALILPAMFHPFGVVLIRQQLKAFPKETLEAARLDGASEWKAYLKIVRPNIGSVTAAVMVLLFADNWNMIDQAVVFIDKTFKMPMSVVLNQISDENPQLFFSASCLYLVPAVLVFLLGQNDLKEGISLSGIKM